MGELMAESYKYAVTQVINKMRSSLSTVALFKNVPLYFHDHTRQPGLSLFLNWNSFPLQVQMSISPGLFMGMSVCCWGRGFLPPWQLHETDATHHFNAAAAARSVRLDFSPVHVSHSSLQQC